MSTVPAVDVSWMSELGQNLADWRARSEAPDILAGLQGTSAPQQPSGFLSNILGGQQQPSLASAANQNQQSAYLPDVQKGQLPTPNPAAAPQVAQAEQTHSLTTNAANAYNPALAESYIRQAAAARNIDPDTAVRVAKSEGLGPGKYVGDSGSSFGPYQLHYGGVAGGGNAVPGLGDAFTQDTGLNARDPSTWKAQIDYSLDKAANAGWGDWHGAANTGIARMQGIGGGGAAYALRNPGTQGQQSPGMIPPQIAHGGLGGGQQLAGPVPTPNAQVPAITVPGYEAAGPVTRAQAAAAPENDARMPGTDEWDAAATKGVPSVNMAAGAPQAQARAPLDFRPPQVAANGVPTVGSAAPTPAGQRFQPSLDMINRAINNPGTHNTGVMYLQQYMQQQQMQQQIQKEQQMALFNHQLGQGRILPEPERVARKLPTGVYFEDAKGSVSPIKGTQEEKTNQPASIQEFEYGQKHPDFAKQSRWVPNATINELGQPQGGWIRPPNPAAMANAAAAPATAEAQAATQEQVQREVGLPDNTKPDNGPSPTLAPEVMQRLQAVPPMRRPIVQAILEGRLPLPKVTSRGGLPVLLNADVTSIDPTFDTTTADARKATRVDFVRGGPSSSKAQIQAGGTGINHLAQLIALSDAIPDYSNIPGVPGPLSQEWGTWAANKLSNADNKAIQNMRGTADAFAGELVKYLTGSEGTQEQRHAFAARIDPSLPAATRKQQILDFTDVIEGRRSELQAAWHNGMGPYVSDFPVLSATSQKSLDRVKAWAGGEGQQAAQPQQQAPQLPSQRVPIPVSAAMALKANPERRPEFNQKYGSQSLPNPADLVIGPAR